ncbi:MAG: NADH-quinone oxidoreductase subunit F [Myxococcales bacterium]|nr:NADH-quinone oxidoreductase subunit F [Myxococcales bacterium]
MATENPGTNCLLRDGDGNDYTDLKVYQKAGGYAKLKERLTMSRDDLREEVVKANLRGRGGAGFPAGVKWGFLPKDTDKPVYLVINADEGEPGTFKDRYFLQKDPHRLLEGCILSSYAIRSNACYIYTRGEFYDEIQTIDKAIADLYEAGLLGKNILGTGYDLDIYQHPGAGAYICGEETALLESLEGKAGQPRMKPPFPAIVGLFGCPTIVNNVETIAAVPVILDMGGDNFAALGTERNGGTKLFGISGHVKKPGLYELPMGFNMKKFIYEVAGGTLDDRPLKAVIPGGSSCPMLTPDEIDIAMDFDSLKTVGSMLGTGGAIVICEPTSMIDVILRISRFYSHESCGQCTPCREGTGWLYRLIKGFKDGTARPGDIDTLYNAAEHIDGHTICALGPAAAWPVQSVVRKFRHEFEAAIQNGGLAETA